MKRLALVLILGLYALFGVLYAVYTPPWQAPDEPAHYNYIRFLAEQRALPVIGPGDYDQAYLERVVRERFPPDLSIAPLTYEDHQPPLYYLLATPVYLLGNGRLLPLRLLSVVLGLLWLTVVHRLARELCPARPAPALIATALAALVPQHIAMTAAVNNDALADLVLATALLVALRPPSRPWTLGAVLGLALLTKTTAYVALPVALLALWWPRDRESFSPRRAAAQTARALLAALILAGPWLARNISLYGWTDPLGLARHNAVVVGQPRTAEWLARYGPAELAARFLRITFQSFWGQFGWMAVPLHPPVYWALALLSGLLLAGFLAWALDRRRPRLSPAQRRSAALLALSALLTVLSYLWYNRTFVQHQGRYLFPALVPLALVGALGLDGLLERRMGALLAGLGPLGLVAGMAWALRRGGLPLWGPTALLLGGLLLLALLRPLWRRPLTLTAWVVGLSALNLYAIFWAIIPTLGQ